MDRVRIAIKKPNEPLEIIDVQRGYRSDTVKKFINNAYPQFVGLDGGKGLFFMGVDEDGLMKNLPTNFYIRTNNFPSEKIVGVAVFTRHKYVNVYIEDVYDYILEDLTDEDIEHINAMLGEEYQKEHEVLYNKNGGNTFRFVTL